MARGTKTTKQLEIEWGPEHYVDALSILVEWLLGKSHPISKDQMRELETESKDAFELFKSRMYHGKMAGPGSMMNER